MSRAMFEYTKTVLNKVSFDTNLFCKEVQKALQRLLPYEIEELKLFIQNLVTIQSRFETMYGLFELVFV